MSSGHLFILSALHLLNELNNPIKSSDQCLTYGKCQGLTNITIVIIIIVVFVLTLVPVLGNDVWSNNWEMNKIVSILKKLTLVQCF